MKINLRSKILLIATVVILFAIAAVIATSTYLSSREYENALHSRSLAIGKSLTIQFERLLQLGLVIDDITGFEEQCQEVVAAYPGIDVAMVVDPDGIILFHSGGVMGRVQGDLYEAVSTGTDGIITQVVDNETHHNAVLPAFTPQGDHVASIVVSFPAELIAGKQRQMLRSELSVGLMVLVTGLLLLYAALVALVTRPLGELIATVLKLRQAPLDLARRTPVTTTDELGQLGSAFNGLMEELQNTTVSKAELELALKELRRVSEALFEQKEYLEVTLRSIGDAVISVDVETRVQYLNPVAEQLMGQSLATVKGRPLQDALRLVGTATNASLPNPFDLAFSREETVSNDVDAELIDNSGARIGVNFTVAPMHDSSGQLTGGVLTLRDVSAERKLAQRLSWEASHDPLTGLVNRREFTARVEAALLTTKNTGEEHVVCFMDLDRFKIVNDTAGHAAGDDFLKALTAVLKLRARQSDTLARLGGDEFALLLEGCSMQRAQLIAADLLAAVENFRFDFKERIFTVGISIGLASVTGDSPCAEVISMADTACYLAKEQGRNRVCVYRIGNSAMTARRHEADWVARINAALAENRFTLYHQTYLALGQDLEPRDHLEVLLRMIDEEGQLVQPGSFLPAAERFNLMPAIDRWVIKNVFANYHRLVTERSGRPLTCAINLSGTSLNTEGLFDFIRDQAKEYGLPAKAICFEITETAAINNLRNAADFIHRCKSLGMLFALDDFGTGTSSFGYLKSLPVDYLKIDGGFVKNMEVDGIDRAMTETIHRIGRIMGIRTVAEYAENSNIINQLREIGVDYAQGYGVCIPKPLLSPDGFGEAADIKCSKNSL